MVLPNRRKSFLTKMNKSIPKTGDIVIVKYATISANLLLETVAKAHSYILCKVITVHLDDEHSPVPIRRYFDRNNLKKISANLWLECYPDK